MKANTREYDEALKSNADRWVPACGGSEQPTLHDGTRWLYCYNHATGKHGYLNLETDMIEVPAFME
jgi:hypothetical protein